MTRFSIVIFLFLIASCRCGNKPTYLLTLSSQKYFSEFLDGSYWVFENVANANDVDTLTLVNRSDVTNFGYTEKPCDGSYTQQVNYMLISKKTNDTLTVTVHTNANIDLYNMNGKYDSLNLSCELELNKKDETFSVNTYFHDTLNIYKTYSINNQSYEDVVRMTFVQFRPAFPQLAPTYLYAKNVGLIGFTVFEEYTNANKTYQLKSYSIVK
ncbi:MAG: hypothetical protein JWO06_1923 [Bacteroidota bacterium]|nr:hypothetical protein [Bacteroidota bacterium]